MSAEYDVLIVGSGHAGAQVAALLSTQGFAGRLGLIGREDVPPYERPALSKGYLVGEADRAAIALRSPSFWAASSVDMRLGAEVVEVDAEAHQVRLSDGQTISYGTLVWAAGGEARTLESPIMALEGVHTLRSMADADRIRLDVADRRHAVVIGGGYVGLETCAAFRGLGLAVTLVETQPRLLSRVSGAAVGEYMADLHRGRGVDIRIDETVLEVHDNDERVVAVTVSSGETIPADLVMVGVGLVPNVAVLAAAGAHCDNGIVTDELCRTSLPDVFAIGDCASTPSAFAGGRVRLESVQNAHDQAKVVVGVLLGNPEPYLAVPWFWSHQYDAKVQTVGLVAGHDQEIVRGVPNSGSFSVAYLKGDRLVALDAINSTKEYVQGRRLVGELVDADRLGDVGVPLRDAVRRDLEVGS